MTSSEESTRHLEDDLGINKILFADVEGTELGGSYSAVLLENRIWLDIYCVDGIIGEDSWAEIARLGDSDYENWKEILFERWATIE